MKIPNLEVQTLFQELGYVFEFKQIEKNNEEKATKTKQNRGKTKEEIAEQRREKQEKEIAKAKQEAPDQIQTKQYTTEMQARGVNRIACIAMVFRSKELFTQFELNQT